MGWLCCERAGLGVKAFVSWMQPRDAAAAAKSLSTLSLVAAGVTLVFAVVQLFLSGRSVLDVGLTIASAVLILLAGWAVRRAKIAHRVTWAVWPLGAIAVIAALDFLTSDASTAAQIFLVFPALYAGSQLRRPGVILVVVAVLVAEWAITCTLLPIAAAVIDASYVSAAVITTAALLTAAGERNEQLVRLLEQQAAIDPLTGLVTRRVLDDAARSAMSGAASEAGTSLILIDVDHFKSINDTYGHPGGDAVLVQLAAVLVAGSRTTDVVSRLGGDEIAVLLPGCSPTALVTRADDVLQRIRAHRFTVGDDQTITVSISGGLAHAPTDAVDLRSLYAAADKALYRAKQSGRNQILQAVLDGTIEPHSATPAAG